MVEQDNDVAGFSNKFNQPLPKADERAAPTFTKAVSAIFVLTVGLFVASRLWHLTTYSLWADEIFSLLAARHNWSGLIAYVAGDIVHPPLFYMLLKLWITIGGESLLWLKLFPFLISVATLFPLFLLCRELKLRPSEMNLALVLIAVNGYLIYFAQELRMYSLLLFLTLCSLWLFVRFFNSPTDAAKRHLMTLFVVHLLLVYTHYYGWLVVGTEFILVLFWRRRKLPLFAISIAVLILCFSPWAYTVAQVAVMKKGLAHKIGWIERPDLYSLLEYYAILNGELIFRFNTHLRFLLFGSPILLWAWPIFSGTRAKDKRRSDTFWLLSLSSFLPIAFAFSVSQVLPQSVWHPRYFIFIAVPYMILVAVAVQRLRPNWVKTAMMLLIVGWAAVAGFKALNGENFSPRFSNHKVEWDALDHQMMQAEVIKDGVVKVYSFDARASIPIQFYLDEAHERRFQVVTVLGDEDKTIIDNNDDHVISGKKFDLSFWDWDYDKESSVLEGEHFWITFYEYQRKEVQRILINKGYEAGEGFKAGPHSYITLAPVWRQRDRNPSGLSFNSPPTSPAFSE